MPTVSVVVPTYDRADVLPRAMDSALEQTHRDLELIVVDDGSTDGTESVVREYAETDDRVRYLAHETNRGANAARNTGIEAADGEYVAFLDSDDEWKPTKLAAQLDRLESGDWVAAYCETETHADGASARLQGVAARVLSTFDEDAHAEGGAELVARILADEVHPAAGSTLVVRTDVARAIGGFDESLDRFQDPDFVVRVLSEGRLAYVDESLVVRHDTGAPAPDAVRRADEQYLRKHAAAVERAESNGFDVLGAHRLVLAKGFLSEGRFVTGLRLLGNARLTARHAPGVLWTAGTGLRRRSDASPVGGAAAAVALAAAAIALLARRRR